MKWTTIIAAAVVALSSQSLFAQSPPMLTPAAPEDGIASRVSDEPVLSEGMISSHPEIYLYMQAMKRHDDPQQAIRRKAELKASQRMGRIASSKWYGISNSRPMASTVPTMGLYSPYWAGNGASPFEWSASSGSSYSFFRVNP
ncbi:MAG: hypothetical protein U0894_20160 [Pirellulales bacterium]